MKPAWDGYFADPDVIRTTEGYFAYGTGSPDSITFGETGRVFPILYSSNLKSWEPVGGALVPPAGMERANYWAPEVVYSGGSYFMYYSAGGEEGEGQRLRVAVADRPEGPFVDQQRVLLPDEPFSIDASPFIDAVTGDAFLFFAKDYLVGDFPGTGTAVVRLAPDFQSVLGDTTELLRATASWQVYEHDRLWYGRMWPSWYTVEGPFCVFRDGQYWLFYSGGRWKGDDYGVGVAVAADPAGPYLEPTGSSPSVLRSRTGLRGPGHNSVVRTSDGVDHICFHAWDEGYTKRQLFIEPLDWSSGSPTVEFPG